MRLHANAALTPNQRTLVRTLYQGGATISALARQFGVDRRTIRRWAQRDDNTDRSTAPHRHGKQVVTDEYRAAVLAERDAHPSYGPKRIAQAIRDRFPSANSGTVWRILHKAERSTRREKKTAAPGYTSRSEPSST